MKAITANKALKTLEALRECIKIDNLNLDACEVHKGEWQIFYNDRNIGNSIPTNAIAFALHTMWLFLKKDLINK